MIKSRYSDSVDVMGVKYSIRMIDPGKEKGWRPSLGGFCDPDTKEIKITSFSMFESWGNETARKIHLRENQVLRHEIVHAFFNESGLRDCSFNADIPWTCNEEMVDWIAHQGPKIYRAWREAGAV